MIDYNDGQPVKAYEPVKVLLKDLFDNTTHAGILRDNALMHFRRQVRAHWRELLEDKQNSRADFIHVILTDLMIDRASFFFELAINYQDWMDVQARIVSLLPRMVNYEIPPDWLSLSDSDLMETLNDHGRTAPEFVELYTFAHARFEEVLKSNPQYAARMPYDPIGS